MTNTTIGREPIQIVEIVQPLCANEFGVSPCTATGTNDEKCYNTRATCQDADNFDGTSTLSLYFGKGSVAEQNLTDLPYIFPYLKSVSTSPTKINLAGSNPDAQGLGNRALLSVTFKDPPHTDRLVDPYLSGRSWDPMTRASFWTKWKARNPFYTNMEIKVHEGYAGEAFSAFETRTYIIQEVGWPSSGEITIRGKDVLARIEDRKAQAPLASPGELFQDITASQTTFIVAGALASEYPASGTVRIDDELITYSAITTVTDGIEFTVTARGSDGTEAATHSFEAAVQECLRYTNQRMDTIVSDLMTTYGGVAASYLDTANWTIEFDNYLQGYNLTTIITEPTPVTDLISEIQVQCAAYFWWSERDALVLMRAIRGIGDEPPLISEEDSIVENGFKLKDKPRERISQVWIYFARRRYDLDFDNANAYAQLVVNADIESEEDEQYGEPSVKKIFGRWLPNSSVANTTASKIINRYAVIPVEAELILDAKDKTNLWTGDNVRISHYLDVDEFGVKRIRNWTIISAEEIEYGHKIKYTLEDTTLYGTIVTILANGSADYSAPAAFGAAYIGDNNGLLSDGERSARIT